MFCINFNKSPNFLLKNDIAKTYYEKNKDEMTSSQNESI